MQPHKHRFIKKDKKDKKVYCTASAYAGAGVAPLLPLPPLRKGVCLRMEAGGSVGLHLAPAHACDPSVS